MSRRIQFAAFLCLMCGVLGASAQSPPQTTQPDPKACAAGEERLEHGPNGPGHPGTTGKGGEAKSDKSDTPSDKLARTDGVICPPNLDPEIRAPAPDAGTMKVIPPPGTPGGKSDVRPK